MSEDDTYDALRRIPIAQLEARASMITSAIRINEQMQRENQIIHEKELKKLKVFPAAPHAVFEAEFNYAASGTGWTYADYVKEIQQKIREHEQLVVQTKKRRNMFIACWMVPLLILLTVINLFFPIIWLKPIIGPLVGYGGGQMLIKTAYKKYPLHAISDFC